MTSNTGAEIIQGNYEHVSEANMEEVMERTKYQVLDLLKHSMRPEFLNRIDEIVMFHPLNKTDIRKIVQIQLGQLQNKLNAKHIHIEATDFAIDYLTNLGYDPQFGARPVKRVIQRNLLNELSKALLSGEVTVDSDIIIDEFNNKLVFRKKEMKDQETEVPASEPQESK
jgi:ATP-dependent Clp protease ATP-binding subunit ClpB